MSPESLDPIFVAENAKIEPIHKGPCQVYCRAIAGSIEGPRRDLDLLVSRNVCPNEIMVPKKFFDTN